MSKAATPRGRYFEDFTVGEEIQTPARTITNTDIVNFACLSGDFNEVHTNHEYLKTTSFGQPIAHGPLIYAVAAGLQYASGVNDGTLIALLQVDNWRMLNPVFHGDTIHMVSKVLDTKLSSKGDRGVVKFERSVINQRGEIVQQMESKYLYKCRPAA